MSFRSQAIRPIGRYLGIASVALVYAAAVSNFGEATITSFGGMGLFVWVTIGWVLAMVEFERVC